MREPIDLGAEQLVEAGEAVRILGRPVQFLHVAADELGNGRRAIRQRAKPVLDDFLFSLPLGDAARVGVGSLGQVFQRGDDAFQFAQFLGVRRHGFLQRVQAASQDGPVAPRVQRQKRLVAPQEERSGAVFDFQLARFESLTILVSEHGPEDSIAKLLFDGVPIDVEVGGVGRGGAVLQHVGPPEVFGGRCAHVIRHGVEDLAHRAAVQGFDHGPVIVLVAQFGVQSRVIDDRISVCAAGPGF